MVRKAATLSFGAIPIVENGDTISLWKSVRTKGMDWVKDIVSVGSLARGWGEERDEKSVITPEKKPVTNELR